MRKIHLEVYDKSKSYKRFKKSERYSILVLLRDKTYYFSNKQKAERFMNQFAKYVTDCYKYFLQLYSDLHYSFTSLFPFTAHHQTFKIKGIFTRMNDVFDMAFANGNYGRDTSTLIGWLFWVETNFVNVAEILKSVARESRNQTEFTKLSNFITSITLFSDSFYSKSKKFEYKGKDSSVDCEVIDLYSPLQIAMNF